MIHFSCFAASPTLLSHDLVSLKKSILEIIRLITTVRKCFICIILTCQTAGAPLVSSLQLRSFRIQVWRCSAAPDVEFSGMDPDLTALYWWSTDPVLMKSIHSFKGGRHRETETERDRGEPQSAVSVIQTLSESIHTSTHHLTFFPFQVLRVSAAYSPQLLGVAW